jgi:predicted nuclease of predicted toxin-antitoxin system
MVAEGMSSDEILAAYPDLEPGDVQEALRYAAEAVRELELARLGHDAVHVRDLGIQAASDEAIFDRAAQQDRVVVSADTDFGTLLAACKQTKPSVIPFRHGSERRPTDQEGTLLGANLPQLEQALLAGSIVVITPDRIRIRALPLLP